MASPPSLPPYFNDDIEEGDMGNDGEDNVEPNPLTEEEVNSILV